MAIIGIDLGTTNSLVSVWQNGRSVLIPNPLGEYLTPSAVSLEEDGTVLVGKAARERLISHPEQSVASFKRAMGTDQRFRLGSREFTPEELSSLVLRRLREDAEQFLGEPVAEAVVSVPAYFTDRQRAATKRAGELAGLRVERLINEPSAAALACRMAQGEEDRSCLVFDFGGGTLDVSVVDSFENIVSILAVSGDNRLGGNDFDRCIAGYFCAENGLSFQSLSPVQQALLLKQAELAKIALASQETVMLVLTGEGASGSLALSRQKFIEISASLFQRMTRPVRRALADSGLTPEGLNDIVLVGGSCKMPAASRWITKFLGKKPVPLGSPDTVVALGAGIYAAMKERRAELKEMVLTDICPFTLGTGVLNPGDPNRPLLAPIIERNSILPTSKSQRFYTIRDGQTKICVDIYQGEGLHCDENLRLGEVNIPIPPAPKGQENVDVRFTYDINGILEVEVCNQSSGRSERAVIVGKESGFSSEEAARRLQELSSLKINPRTQEENRLALARGERLYQETLGEARQKVAQAVGWFEQVLARQEPLHIAKSRKRFLELLDLLEAGSFPESPGGDFWEDEE